MTGILMAALLSLPAATNSVDVVSATSSTLQTVPSRHAATATSPLILLYSVTTTRPPMIAKVELAKSDEITFNKVYDAIREHEPLGMDNPDDVHPDGVSWGRSGVTYRAVERLIDDKYIERGTYDLSDPIVNEMVGRAYLRLGLRIRGSLWGAVEFYHGDHAGTRAPKGKRKYAETIWGLLK